jgi:tRNA U54 and U55 pseudouridine synthase Pus10
MNFEEESWPLVGKSYTESFRQFVRTFQNRENGIMAIIVTKIETDDQYRFIIDQTTCEKFGETLETFLEFVQDALNKLKFRFN